MNYVIVGAKGFLGSYLMKKLSDNGHKIIATARDISNLENTKNVEWISFDVRNKNDIQSLNDKMSIAKDWIVLYLAALHHPDVVQKQPKVAWDVNITCLSYFINKINNISSFYYPSTDTVYGDGTLQKKFKEYDELNPVNLYGKQKALAEKIVITYGYNVVRYPFLIGRSYCPNKKHFYDIICDTIKSGKSIDMFSDSYRSVLSFDQAADYLIYLTQMDQNLVPNLINISSDDAISKYEVGLRIAKLYNISTDLIKPITIDKSEGIFEVKRASTTLMDNTILKKLLNVDYIHFKLN